MYGRGQYTSQFGQGSQTPIPQFQQHPMIAPPSFQQGTPASQHSVTQEGPPSIPPHICHSGPPVYQHVPTLPIQQAPPVQAPTIGILNVGQSYLLPPRLQQVHGSTSVVHSCPTVQNNLQWTHNMHHALPPVPPPGTHCTGPSCPEMFRPSLRTGLLPALHLQGQTPPGGPIHLQQSSGAQGTQQIPPPPPLPPSTSNLFSTSPYGSFPDAPATVPVPLQPPPPPPPPPPSSPPPLPPSPPPSTSPHLSFGTLSSKPVLSVSDLLHNSDSGPTPNNSGFEVVASDSAEKVNQSDDAPAFDYYKKREGTTSSEVGSSVKGDLSSVEGTILDLPPPPPKPVEEKVVRKIEVLCNFIARNGPGFENMARQKEFGNPEFEFLFGGDPGSEAAIAFEYFEWMKKKCILAFRLQHEHNNSVSRPSDVGISTQTKFLMNAGVSQSHSDSDMDMEDDITQPDDEDRIHASLEGLNSQNVLIPKDLDIGEQVPAPRKDTVSTFSGVAGQEKDEPARCSLKSNIERSTVPPQEDLSQSNVPGAAASIGSEKNSGELIKGASPFRLLQDYASDDSSGDDDKPCLEDSTLGTSTPSTAAGATSLHGETVSNLLTVPGSKSLSISEMAFGIISESIVACSQGKPSNALEFSPDSQGTAEDSNVTSIATVKTEEIFGNQESLDNVASPGASQHKEVSHRVRDAGPERGESESQKEEIKCKPTLPKVDEFGRLVREGATDSDSDESDYAERHTERGRSWSRSQSPHDRRRMMSPRRRKDKRSRSRSWSPKKRRSRSRSPTFRHRYEYGGEKGRRDKGELPECFDFLRGRCHRGAFCRYMHHGSVERNGGRRYRSKQQYAEALPVSKTSDFHEDIEKNTPKRLVNKHDIPRSSFFALKDRNLDGKKALASEHDVVQTSSGQDDMPMVPETVKSERSREVATIIHETHGVKEEILESTNSLHDNETCLKRVETFQPVNGLLTDAGAPIQCGDTSRGIAASVKTLVIQSSETNHSLPVIQNVDHQPQHADGFSTSGSHASTSLHSQFLVSEPHLNQISSAQSYPSTSSISQSFSSESLPSKELTAPTIPAADFPDYNLPLPPPPPSSLSQPVGLPPVPQLSREQNLMQSASKFSYLSSPMENCPPYQGPLQTQHSHFAVPSTSSWSLPHPLPLQPPLLNSSVIDATTAMLGVPSLQFQQNQLSSRDDPSSQMFISTYPPEVPVRSQLGDFKHHSYQEPPRSSWHMDDFRPKTLPMSNPVQTFGGTGFVADHFSKFPVQALNPSNSFAHRSVPPHPMPSLSDSAATRMQSFPDPYLQRRQQHQQQQQQQTHGLQQPAADVPTVNVGAYGNVSPDMSRYASDHLNKNQPPHLSAFGGSRISSHYNPYASTFDQPLSSKFSVNVFKQERDMLHSNVYDASYGLSHVPVDGHGVGSLVSRHVTSSPKSVQAADLTKLGSDQYDPIFDSIEPSSNSFKKFDRVQKHEPSNDSTLRLSGSRKPLDVEENNKQKDAGVVTLTMSGKSENDEYGETADAEVGDVENLSASSPPDAENTAVGEIEIDQVKMPGKNKKSKDSRSMKLFKVAIADFVKEEIKPYWRQGRMSKEAFKTIVKKTVEKVSGAMMSRQIPKSQAKINHYIESSRRKLAKLARGYVHKYVTLAKNGS